MIRGLPPRDPSGCKGERSGRFGIVPAGDGSFEQAILAQAPAVLREMVRAFAHKMMDAEAGAACGAATER
jgi:hypothetical protein